jgi:hypothetical protein
MEFEYREGKRMSGKKDLIDRGIPVSFRNFLDSQRKKGNGITLYSKISSQKYEDWSKGKTVQDIMSRQDHRNRIFGLSNESIKNNLETSNVWYEIEDSLYFVELGERVRAVSFLDSMDFSTLGSQEMCFGRALGSLIFRKKCDEMERETKGGAHHHFGVSVNHGKSEFISPYVYTDIDAEGVGLYYYEKFSSALLSFTSYFNKWVDEKRGKMGREALSIIEDNEKINL